MQLKTETTVESPRRRESDAPSKAAEERTSRWRGTLAIASLGSLLMWAALPPLDLWPLAWVATIPWLMLCRMSALPGKRPYLALWAAGFGFWLAAVHWLRLPHPATSIGWVALSFYLALYLPAFVGFTRTAVHRLKLPLIMAAPIVWTGLELAKGHLLSGFSMGLLGHTQWHWPQVIQIADFGGAYAVSFALMFVGACLARMWPCEDQRWAVWPVFPAAALVVGALTYGHFAIDATRPLPGPKVALIQGSIDTTMKADPNEVSQIHKQYIDLTGEAIARQPDVELIVWPETMCRSTLVECGQGAVGGARLGEMQMRSAESHAELQQFAQAIGKKLLLGVDVFDYDKDGGTRYNSAVWVEPNLGVVNRYDKQHRVMFGEYVPFANRFPWLYRLTPLGSGIGAGKSDRLPAFELGTTKLSANICFESAVPHLIRRHVADLRKEGREPDVLVNLTNDGWFWGSSELDMHLACGVFRAVELRKPFLIAANTGFSAWIDSCGKIIEQGPRRATGVIIAKVQVDPRKSFYSEYGDLFSGFCLVVAMFFALAGLWPKPRA